MPLRLECTLSKHRGRASVHLCDGVHRLGRGELLMLKDARCSRHQLTLFVGPDGATVKASAQQRNPSMVTTASGGVRTLKPEQATALSDGDVLTFVNKKHKYRVVMRDAQQKRSASARELAGQQDAKRQKRGGGGGSGAHLPAQCTIDHDAEKATV